MPPRSEQPGFDASISRFAASFFRNSNYRFSTSRSRSASVSCFLNSVFCFQGVKNRQLAAGVLRKK
jgi:hypothetical protein